jgi:predicted TIM-barrel fold metal-dependent hydrolase
MPDPFARSEVAVSKLEFRDIADIDYPIIDADAHVNEPPDLWQTRVPSKLRDRAPKVEHRDDGDYWSFDDGKRSRPLGFTAVAGLSYLDFKPAGITYAETRPGSWDTKARLIDMDIDGIHAQVLYPSVTLAGAKMYAEADERELQLACVRAYNDWLAEMCQDSDGRLIPQAIMPTTNVEDLLAEAERALGLGHKGLVISTFPNGTLEPDVVVDEPFWRFCEEADVPAAVHIGSFMPQSPSARAPNFTERAFLGKSGATKAGSHTIPVASEMLFAGFIERFPKIKVLLVEANIGWIPTLVEQIDDMYLRYRFFTGRAELDRWMPSELFHRNMWATFMKDSVGVDLRYRMNMNHIMWSTDYPHTGCNWPNSRVTIEYLFRGLPADEVKLFLHTNVKRLYNLDHIPDTLPHANLP